MKVETLTFDTHVHFAPVAIAWPRFGSQSVTCRLLPTCWRDRTFVFAILSNLSLVFFAFETSYIVVHYLERQWSLPPWNRCHVLFMWSGGACIEGSLGIGMWAVVRKATQLHRKSEMNCRALTFWLACCRSISCSMLMFVPPKCLCEIPGERKLERLRRGAQLADVLTICNGCACFGKPRSVRPLQLFWKSASKTYGCLF